MLFSIIFHYIQTNSFYSFDKIINEVFYLQSYGTRIWDQTWSLAVEEHFYLLLALVTFLIVKLKKIEKRRNVIITLVSILIYSLGLRIVVSLPHLNENFYFFQTHLRLDGIAIGVLISYLYYFTNFYDYFKRKKIIFLVVSFILIFPGFIFEGGSFFMNTLGLTLVNLGFGILTLISLEGFKINFPDNIFIKPIYKLVCLIGVHSYSIYLWHLLVRNELSKLEFNVTQLTLLFFVISISLGITVSLMIEKPFLIWRDRKIT